MSACEIDKGPQVACVSSSPARASQSPQLASVRHTAAGSQSTRTRLGRPCRERSRGPPIREMSSQANEPEIGHMSQLGRRDSWLSWWASYTLDFLIAVAPCIVWY